MSLPAALPYPPLKVEDYCSEFTSDPPPDFSPDCVPEIDHPRRLSPASVDPAPLSPAPLQSSQDEPDDCWNLIPYNVPWGNNYHNYHYGTLPGPEGACIFLRSPTPAKNQRTSQACKKCRERKAKCSGSRPSCERCLARGHTCVYVDDPKRVRRTVSGSSLGRRSHRAQSRSVSISGRASSQFMPEESPLDDDHCSSPCSPVMGMLPLDPDSETDFSTPVEFTHEDLYDGVIQLTEAPYMLSIQSASLDQSANPPPASVLSPQPMRYPHLVPLLIPGGDDIPALESSSSSPASSSSQSTPLLGYQPGMYDHGFVTGEYGYDRSTQFQSYCIPRSIQYPHFDQTPLVLPMGCTFDESSHQVYTVGGNGEHPLTSTEELIHPYNEELLVRPQFVSY